MADAPNYKLGEALTDGASATVWLGQVQVCTVWRPTAAQTNADAQRIIDALLLQAWIEEQPEGGTAQEVSGD